MASHLALGQDPPPIASSSTSVPKAKPKVACSRCRSLKARCPGPSAGSKDCAKCIKAGAACVSEDHRRGRKAGSRLPDPARALSRMKESFDTIMKQKELLSASGSSSQPTTPPFPPSSSSSSSRRNQPPPRPSSSTPANSFYDSIASLSSSSRFNNQPPPPHRPSFDDFGPSSQSSSSLAQLFAVKTADEDRKSRRAERPIYRQDPIDLGYLTEEDSRILFAFFMEKINPKVALFDELLHTHDFVRRSSLLLFCTILCVAMKFSPLLPVATRVLVLALAKDSVLRIISDDGGHRVESVQSLLLLVEYKEPDDQQSYILLGLACRLAMDLDLGRPRPHLNDRENQNRVRTWFVVFIVDRRLSKYGQELKATMCADDDASIKESVHFHRNPAASRFDARLVALVQLRRLLSRYDALLKANADRTETAPMLDLKGAFVDAERELAEWRIYWTAEIQASPNNDFADNKEQLLSNEEHGKLQIATHWLFQTFPHSNLPDVTSFESWSVERTEALSACLRGSLSLLDRLSSIPDEVISFAPDSFHLFFSSPTFFLRRIFKAQLLNLLDLSSIAGIFTILRSAIATLERATLHPSHTIALHTTLLRSLLAFSPPKESLPPPSPAPWLGIRSIPAPPPPRTNTNLDLSNPVFFPPPDASTGPIRVDYGNESSGTIFPFFTYGGATVQPMPREQVQEQEQEFEGEGEGEGEEGSGYSPLEDQLQLEDTFDTASLGLEDGRGWEELFNEALLSSSNAGGGGDAAMFDFLVQN